jgi:hypothetical protein
MPVSAGDKLSIRAADWNDFQRMLLWWRRTGGTFPGGPAGNVAPSFVQIKNTTASDVGAFGVLAIDAPIIDLANYPAEKFEGIRFDGVAPSTSTPHYGKFAVLQEPATKNGGFARAVIAGETLVKLNIADADDVACDIANGVTGSLLTSMHGSARITWKSTGTGSTDKWGLIQVGDWEPAMLGKTDAAIAKGASGVVSVWDGVEGSESDTGVNVTAYNRFANVAISKWVMVASKRGRLYLIAAEC